MNFVKIKEKEKIDKYLDLSREQGKLWNMNVTVISIVISALGMVPKGWKGDWAHWRSEEESRSYRPSYCYDQLEYLEDSW